MPRNLPRKASISYSQRPAMELRPDLAIYVARVATGWTRVEQTFAHLVVQLLGAHAHAGMKMYQALSGAGSQRAVLRAVARDRLPDDMLDDLEAILDKAKKAANKRNKVVHGLWEISDDLPDALIWCDSSDELLVHGEFWANWLSRGEPERYQWAAKEFKSRPRYMVYEAKDFEDILSEIQSVLGMLLPFVRRCMSLNEPPSNETGLAGG